MGTETPAGAGNTLPADFPDQYQNWYKAVAKVFARVRKQDVADVPLDIWKKLVRTNYDGIDVNPLYTRDDELPELATPGAFPFTRGTSAHSDGWGVAETFAGANPNKELLHALEFGTSAPILDVREGMDLNQALSGVYLNMVPLRLVAGARVGEAAKELYEVVGDTKEINVELGAAPLTNVLTGAEGPTLEDTVQLAKDAPEGVRAILVDAVAISNQGATDSQEIGLALAVGVEYVRALVDAGLSPAEALDQISFRLAATDDQFGQIAKFRAFRQLWARISEVIGAPEHGAARVHAVTAPVMFSQRDPYVNMLRCTVAAFAAGVGGADDVEVLPFDNALAEHHAPRSFAHRIARNTNLLLLEESHLGFVQDPAGGSYYVESLTDQLAGKAWEEFTGIDGLGGFTKNLDGIKAALAESAERIRNDVSRRLKKVTGVNEFPNLAEKPLSKKAREGEPGVIRWAAAFEELRDRSDDYLEEHGERPKMGLIPLGKLAKHNIRTGFTTNLLATGGIEALNPGQVVPGTEEFDAAATAADIVVICGTDAEYGQTGPEALAALRKAGAGTVLLAGAPKSFEGQDDAPDGYLNMKINAAETLSDLLDKLGA